MLSWFRRIEQELVEIKKEITANRKGLDEHMRRTDLLEKKMESIPQKIVTYLSIISGFLIVVKVAFSVIS